MKYIITSKISGKKYLIDGETDDFQKELLQVIQSSENGPFLINPFLADRDHKEIWAIYLDKVATD